MMDRPEGPSKPTEHEVRDEIATEIQRIYEESYGHGAQRTEAILNEDWVIVLLDGLNLLPSEEFLADNGDGDAVARVRSQYQREIQAPLRAAVERATGRSVVGSATTTSVDKPRFSVEIFRLS